MFFPRSCRVKKKYYSTSRRFHERVENKKILTDAWWWCFVPPKSQQSGKWILINFEWHLFSLLLSDFGESFIKNDPVQTLRNFSLSRVIGQRWVHQKDSSCLKWKRMCDNEYWLRIGADIEGRYCYLKPPQLFENHRIYSSFFPFKVPFCVGKYWQIIHDQQKWTIVSICRINSVFSSSHSPRDIVHIISIEKF